MTFPADPAVRRTVRRRFVLIALIAIAPVVASYSVYYLWPRERQVNYGTLHAVPVPALAGRVPDGRAFDLAALRGRWVLLYASGGACDASCKAALSAGRQSRTIQNAERERVVRVWLVTDGAPAPAAVLSEHPDLVVVNADAHAAARLPDGGRDLYFVDPLGNLVLSWPAEPDIKAMAKDIGRLLRASRIG
jgi:hypothetical protein